MLKTLRLAYKKQQRGEHIGQVDLDGSFTSLLKRGLIDLKTISSNRRKNKTWFVTREGEKALSKLGFDDVS